MKRDMKKVLGVGVAALGIFLAAGIPALAKTSRSVTLQYGAVLQGSALPAGKYSVQWDKNSPEPTIQFLQHHKVVLSAEGRIEKRDKGYERDAIVYGTTPNGSISIVEIRFADSNRVLVFNP